MGNVRSLINTPPGKGFHPPRGIVFGGHAMQLNIYRACNKRKIENLKWLLTVFFFWMDNRNMTGSMLETNLKKTGRLIHDLLEAIPIDLLRDVVIFGSAAISLHGIDLKRKIDDLDLFVSQDSFDQLKRHPELLERKKHGATHLTMKDRYKIELWASFAGVDYESVKKHARPTDGSSQMAVADLVDLRQWKKTQGREKDIADLQCMGSE